jgi:hypothetical protein
MASTGSIPLLSVEEEDAREISLWGKVKFFAITSVGFFSEGWINNNLSFSTSPPASSPENLLTDHQSFR